MEENMKNKKQESFPSFLIIIIRLIILELWLLIHLRNMILLRIQPDMLGI